MQRDHQKNTCTQVITQRIRTKASRARLEQVYGPRNAGNWVQAK